MNRLRAASGFSKAALGASLLTLAVACGEDGMTVPAGCVEGVDQPIFDIKTPAEGGAAPDYSAIPAHDYPYPERCSLNNTGHAVSPSGEPTDGGTSAGGTVNGGADGGGAAAGGSDAGAGGS